METRQLIKLEKDKKFRRKISSEGIWKDYSFVPPIIIIFGAVFGLLYLLNNNLLTSIYTIPFAIIFIIATLWFKSVRKFLIDKKIANQFFYQICVAYPLFDNQKNTIIIFATDNYRHSTNYLNKQKKDILSNDKLCEELSKSNIPRLDILDSKTSNNICISSISKTKETEFYIIYTNNKNIIKINKKSLSKFI